MPSPKRCAARPYRVARRAGRPLRQRLRRKAAKSSRASDSLTPLAASCSPICSERCRKTSRRTSGGNSVGSAMPPARKPPLKPQALDHVVHFALHSDCGLRPASRLVEARPRGHQRARGDRPPTWHLSRRGGTPGDHGDGGTRAAAHRPCRRGQSPHGRHGIRSRSARGRQPDGGAAWSVVMSTRSRCLASVAMSNKAVAMR
jgi:hypothetical protein